MMIIFGTRENQIGQKHLAERCTGCKSQTLFARYLQRSFHFFWLPTYPLKKFTYVFCTSCRTLYDENYLQPALQQEVQKHQTETPKWMYSGLIFMILLFIFTAVYEHFETQSTKQYLASPQAGDIYLIHMDSNKGTGYVYMKLEEVYDNTFSYSHGKYIYSRTRDASKALRRLRKNSQDYFHNPIRLNCKSRFYALIFARRRAPLFFS